MHSIPPRQSPSDTKPVTTTTELHLLWRRLMGELGFGYRSLWVMPLAPNGKPLGGLQRVEHIPVHPDPKLLETIALVVKAAAPRRHRKPAAGALPLAAVLLSRPGGPELAASDRAWAAALADEADRTGVPFWPMCAANDLTLEVVEPPLAA